MTDSLDLTGKKIMLVGGAGFIGHNMALALKRLGADVLVVDGLQVNNLMYFLSDQEYQPNRTLYTALLNQRLDLLSKADIPVIVQDARDYHNLVSIIDQYAPNVLLHLAAVAHANRANKNPFTTFDHSLRTLENALDAVRLTGTHFIYFSSSLVYGNFNDQSVTEDTACNPLGIYGALKFSAEKLLIAYNQVFNTPYTIIRPSALYGERCVSRRVVQAFVENAMRGLPLTINGDGSDRLDFTYIRDFIQGVVRCIVKPMARNQTFNITYGNARSINELLDIVRSYFPQVEVQHNERSSLMPERGTLCIDKARSLLGYTPAYPIERGLESYVGWYKSSPQLFEQKTG